MVEIEKPRIDCVENPGDSSYGKYVVEPWNGDTVRLWATPCVGSCCLPCLALQ